MSAFEDNLPLKALKARVIEELRAAEEDIPLTDNGVLTDAGILYLADRMLDPEDSRTEPRDFMRKSWREGLVSTDAIQDLLKRTESHPILGSRGEVVTNGFSYSRDELIALLQECSEHTAIGVHSIDHYDPTGDGTSLRITVYATFARSEVDMPNRKV